MLNISILNFFKNPCIYQIDYIFLLPHTLSMCGLRPLHVAYIYKRSHFVSREAYNLRENILLYYQIIRVNLFN